VRNRCRLNNVCPSEYFVLCLVKDSEVIISPQPSGLGLRDLRRIVSSGNWQETPSNMSHYYAHLVTFYEDDMFSFLLGPRNILWSGPNLPISGSSEVPRCARVSTKLTIIMRYFCEQEAGKYMSFASKNVLTYAS
jgi:hypothetical protein